MRSLRLQLLVSHLLLVLLLGVVMAGAIQTFYSLSRSMQHVTESDLGGEVSSEGMRSALGDEATAVDFYLIEHPELGSRMLVTARRDFLLNLARCKASSFGRVLPKLADQAARQHTEFQAGIAEFVATYGASGRRAAEELYRTRVEPVAKRLGQTIDALIQLNHANVAQAADAAKAAADRAFFTSFGVTLIALALAIFLALRMVRMALTPLALLAKQAEVIGGGDLTRQIDLHRTDEIGALADSFNAMAVKLAELRKSEVRRLQRAERMSDAALESLYDPVIVTDARARIVHLNSAAQGLFGPAPVSPRVDVESLIRDGRIVRAVRGAVQQEAISASEDVASQVPIRVGEARRTYRLRSTPMFADEGLLLGSVTVLEDITHLKELDRLKSEFIGVASHELRTPVTSLLLSVQLLEEGAAGPLSERQRSLVEAQREDLKRLESLMRELLDVTRLEAGTMVPRLSIVPAKELLQATAEAVHALAAERRIDVTIAPETTDARVRADRSQILRVLVNLVDNALRHTPPGGIVRLSAEDSADDVRFCVEDTGQGIPEEYLANIFDRFVQVPGATRGGAGLGLSIVQTIVRAHGGAVGVTSRPGAGSRFTFTLKREPGGREVAGAQA